MKRMEGNTLLITTACLFGFLFFVWMILLSNPRKRDLNTLPSINPIGFSEVNIDSLGLNSQNIWEGKGLSGSLGSSGGQYKINYYVETETLSKDSVSDKTSSIDYP